MNNSYVVADEINSLVNRSTTYMTDWQQYGLPEYWEAARPGCFEDCDGYALAKRGQLIATGWPLDKQMLCVCITETGEGHLVEAAETDRGWFIMDNRFAGLMNPLDLKYTWVSCLKGGKWKDLKSWA